LDKRGFGEDAFLFKEACLDKLPRQREGHKHRPARAFALGLMGQPCAAVHLFFNV
jgi:hypothetical protein